MKKGYILIIIATLTLYGCSEGIAVFVQFLALDSKKDKLEIEFNFKRLTKDENVYVKRIEIYESDTLIYDIETASNGITHWTFPKLPNNFKFNYPNNVDEIKLFKKSSNLRFEFSGTGKYSAFGSWQYEPKYSDQKYRWMFDENGSKKITIDCSYESWIGKDIIMISSNSDFKIDKKSFKLLDINRESIEFEVKTKRNPTNRIAIVLNNKMKRGEKALLSFKAHNDQTYEDIIIVPNKKHIGIVGKYNDL